MGPPPRLPVPTDEADRATFEHAAVGIGHMDLDGRWFRTNRRLCQLAGRGVDDLMGVTIHDITHPDERELLHAWMGRLLDGRVDSFTLEQRFLRPDGTAVWADCSTSLVRDDDGGPLYLIGIARDISRRKAAETALASEREALERERRRLETVLELLPAGVWIADADGRIVQANAAASELWGGDAPASHGAESYHEDYRAVWLDGRPVAAGEWALARAVERGERSGPEEVRIERFDGTSRTILNYGVPIRDGDGAIEGAVALSVDVTAHKRTEAELRAVNEHLIRARHEAEAATRARTEFIATVSHELRTPLHAITGYAQLLQAGVPAPLDEGQKVSVERIAYCARHLQELIDEILTYSRLEAGREQVDDERVDLGEVLDEVRAVIEPLAAEKGLVFRVEETPHPTTVRTDPGKLRQVLLNLLGNATKFTERGSIVLRAGATAIRSYSEFGTRESACSKRSGPGSSSPSGNPPPRRVGVSAAPVSGCRSASASRLFSEAPCRSRASPERAPRSSCACHAGSSEMEAGTGSCEGPGGAARADTTDNTDTRERGDPSSAAAPRRTTILVVEDDHDARFVLTAIFEHNGFRVLEARNGEEGVALARDHTPDLVVMDIHMPVMDGFTAGEVLRGDERTRGIPVVAVTADRFGAEGQARVRSLFHSCLWKPIEPLRLLQHVRGILGG